MLSLVLPWYAKWVAILVLVLAVAGYTGIKVASHYQDKLNDIHVAGQVQAQHNKQVEKKQEGVTVDVEQAVKDAVAANTAYWRKRMLQQPTGANPTSQVPQSTGSTTPTSQGVQSDSRLCQDSDAAEDAITILGWQRWYNEQLEASQ